MRNKHVWVLDDKEGYLPGMVITEEGEFADVSVGFEVSASFKLSGAGIDCCNADPTCTTITAVENESS
jgi:hypothetical protein